MKIASVFLTVDGEVTLGGPWQWTVFVRTGGCNLRCWKSSGFCDAPHTLEMNGPYEDISVREVISRCFNLGNVKRCTITGGEPLLQMYDVKSLSRALTVYNWLVTIETSGSILFDRQHDLGYIDSVILDMKPPSTEMAKMNKYELLERLGSRDYVKFVLENRADYDWAIKIVDEHPTAAQVAFGVRWGYLELRQVLDWLRADERWDIQGNVQSHKYIWEGSHPVPTDSLKTVNFEEMVAREH